MDKSAQIKIIKAKIALLDAEKEQLIKKLCNIEKETVPSADSPPVTLENLSNQPTSLDKKLEFTQEQQIRLFRSLFRGRDDVYARLWMSRKTGRSGYSPVCKNEWAPKICQKPIMKCSHCPNRELMLLDDEVIRRHLSGTHIVGIYPMLQDESCYFLAIDFDGENWSDNVFAFRKTCEQEGVPVAVERSRSGNGAHV